MPWATPLLTHSCIYKKQKQKQTDIKMHHTHHHHQYLHLITMKEKWREVLSLRSWRKFILNVQLLLRVLRDA